MRFLLIFILSYCLLASCSNEYHPSRIDFLENDTIPVSQKIQKLLETPNLLDLGFNTEQSRWLQQYYKARGFKPLWINDSTTAEIGIELRETLNRSLWFGLPEERLMIVNKKKKLWIEEELVLTAKIALTLNDLNNGFMNFAEKKYRSENFVSVDYLDSMLKQKDTISFERMFFKQGPSDTVSLFMKEKIYDYCRSYPLDKKSYDMRAFKLDSIHTYRKAVRALVSKGYLKDGADSMSYVSSLKLFQIHNGLKPDGKVGLNTATALNESTYDKLLRAALVLDRMRQSEGYPEKHIRINIPEYLLRYYVKDSLKRVHNIIVGKEENQTPELNSKVRNIVVYPYWKVPYSIASKEILPEAKRSAKYFTRNNFKLYRNDKEVNPYSVNWSRIKKNSFPYEVIQQPGPENSLGIIKFEFQNSFSVYVHDTPTKYLFTTDVRSYSHGCMRCQDPVDLAKTILDYDSIGKKRNDITSDSLDSLLTLGENYSIKLKDPVPIYVEYNTVYADREKFIFYLDIYKRDEEYLKIIHE